MASPHVNEPTVWILLRGLTRGSMHWLGFDELFRRKFPNAQVLCPDLAGNGLLFQQDTPPSIDAAVSQIRDQVIAVRGKKMALFGVSMGGMIAARWAEMYPSEISHLVVLNSSFASLSRFYQRLLPRVYFGLIKSLFVKDPKKIEEFIMNATSNQEKNWRPYLSKLIEYQMSYPVSLSNFNRQLHISGQTQFKGKPPVQTLILNSEGDQLVSPQCSRAIARSWECKLQTHPSAGHDLPLDAPDWVLQQVQSFVIND